MTSENVDLLKNIFYGYEILDRDTTLRWVKQYFGHELSEASLHRIYDSVYDYFMKTYSGVFGGQITAGDGLLIAAMMERVVPTQMLEFGVASGYSSAFILHHANMMGLLREAPFLQSFDLVSNTDDGNKTGSMLRDSFPQFAEWWSLRCEVTSADLATGSAAAPQIRPGARVLAFVDAGHNHPWPVMDLAYLRSILPRDTWVVLQDCQMMERWIADCVKFGSVCPAPVRGVNLAVALWPRRKIIGHELCYNSSVVQLNVSDPEFQSYAQEVLRYPDEIDFPRRDLIRSLSGSGR